MTRLVFIDTETTSLRPDRRAWEVGLIERVPVVVRHPDGPDTSSTEDREHHWFIDTEDLDLGNADLMSLKIGRFHERHPQMRGRRTSPSMLPLVSSPDPADVTSVDLPPARPYVDERPPFGVTVAAVLMTSARETGGWPR